MIFNYEYTENIINQDNGYDKIKKLYGIFDELHDDILITIIDFLVDIPDDRRWIFNGIVPAYKNIPREDYDWTLKRDLNEYIEDIGQNFIRYMDFCFDRWLNNF